jgi:hypothetical protein
VNKGTKEGGINSPPIFNSAYVTVLQRLNISEFPDTAEDVDRNKVYYIVFADDLVLVSENLTRLEEETGNLAKELERLGMTINADKTKWMMFLPLFPTVVPSRESLRLRLGAQDLEMVQEFTYLGFTIDCYASLSLHALKREKLLLQAAVFSGKLMRQLEVTNLRCLRSYFYALVSSQLYGQSCAIFSSEVYGRAQKVFLQEAWNLPKSFPIHLASFLLGTEQLEAIALWARLRFIQHLLAGNGTRASLSAMILDRTLLLPRRVGWTHDLVCVVPSLSEELDIRSVDLSSPSITNELLADLSRILAARVRNTMRNSSTHHLLSFFPTLSISRTLGDTMGDLSLETVRMFILFLANMTRFSYLRPINAPCPFCSAKMYSNHFFDCEQYAVLGDEIVSWRDVVNMFARQEWLEGITSTFRRLLGWSRRANRIFRLDFRHIVDEYYEEIVWARNDRIRRAGGIKPPNLQWSIAS